MLVVEPISQRFEESAARGFDYEEHLLERVTILENHMSRFAEKLEKTLDLLLRQARSSYLDHVLLESLISLLSDTELIKRPTLMAKWREVCERDNFTVEQSTDAPGLCERVLARGCDEQAIREQFGRLVRDGFECFGEGDVAAGLCELEKAAALASSNAPLNAFVGEHRFRRGEMALARDYLARALDAEPDDGRVRLLLGLACGDEGDWRRAKELLTQSCERDSPSYAAHYALGRLFAAESDWDTAIAHFKLALNARDCPEAHYVLGVSYYQLGRYRAGLRHLMKAVKVAPDYGEAFYVLGLIRLQLGQRALAREAFDAASALDENEPRYRAAKRAARRSNVNPPPPSFLSPGRRRRRGLVTGGDHRLAAALAADALGETDALPR
jgi:tetratricopeptide (TPR) repeat protein